MWSSEVTPSRQQLRDQPQVEARSSGRRVRSALEILAEQRSPQPLGAFRSSAVNSPGPKPRGGFTQTSTRTNHRSAAKMTPGECNPPAPVIVAAPDRSVEEERQPTRKSKSPGSFTFNDDETTPKRSAADEPSTLMFMSPQQQQRSSSKSSRKQSKRPTEEQVNALLEQREAKRDAEEEAFLMRLSGEIDELNRRNNELTQVNEQLEADKSKVIAHHQVLTDSVAQINDELLAERERSKQLELDLSHAQDETKAQRQEYEKELAFEKAQTQQAIKFEREEVEHLLQKQIDSLTKKLFEAEEFLTNKDDLIERTSAERDNAEQEVELLREALKDSDACIAKVRDELAAESARSERLQRKAAAIDKKQESVEALRQEDAQVFKERIAALEGGSKLQADDIRKKLHRLQTLEKDKEQLNATIGQMETQHAKLQDKFDGLCNELQNLAHQIATADVVGSSTHADPADLSDSESMSDADADHVGTPTGKMLDFDTVLSPNTDERPQVVAKPKMAPKPKLASKAPPKKPIAKSRSLNNSAVSVGSDRGGKTVILNGGNPLQLSNFVASRLKSLMKEHRECKNEVKSVRAKCKHAEKCVSHRDAQIKQLETTISQFDQQRECYEKELQTVQEVAQALDADNNVLRTAADECQRKLHEESTALQKLNTQYMRLMFDNDEHKATSGANSERIKELERLVATAEERTVAVEKDIADETKRADKAAENVAALQTDLKNAERELQKTKDQCRELMDSKDKLRQKLRNVSEENSKHAAKSAELSKELTVAVSRCKTLENKIVLLRRESDKQQRQLVSQASPERTPKSAEDALALKKLAKENELLIRDNSELSMKLRKEEQKNAARTSEVNEEQSMLVSKLEKQLAQTHEDERSWLRSTCLVWSDEAALPLDRTELRALVDSTIKQLANEGKQHRSALVATQRKIQEQEDVIAFLECETTVLRTQATPRNMRSMTQLNTVEHEVPSPSPKQLIRVSKRSSSRQASRSNEAPPNAAKKTQHTFSSRMATATPAGSASQVVRTAVVSMSPQHTTFESQSPEPKKVLYRARSRSTNPGLSPSPAMSVGSTGSVIRRAPVADTPAPLPHLQPV